MTSNVGSTTNAKGESNIVGFTFGEKAYEELLFIIEKCGGNECPQLLINGIQKTIWKGSTYKLNDLRNLSVKHTRLQHTIKCTSRERIQSRLHLKSSLHQQSRIKLTSTKSTLRTKDSLKEGGNVTYINNT